MNTSNTCTVIHLVSEEKVLPRINPPLSFHYLDSQSSFIYYRSLRSCQKSSSFHSSDYGRQNIYDSHFTKSRCNLPKGRPAPVEQASYPFPFGSVLTLSPGARRFTFGGDLFTQPPNPPSRGAKIYAPVGRYLMLAPCGRQLKVVRPYIYSSLRSLLRANPHITAPYGRCSCSVVLSIGDGGRPVMDVPLILPCEDSKLTNYSDVIMLNECLQSSDYQERCSPHPGVETNFFPIPREHRVSLFSLWSLGGYTHAQFARDDAPTAHTNLRFESIWVGRGEGFA